MIYFVQGPQGGTVKIGKSVDVERRLVQLRSYYACDLVVLKVLPGYAEEEAELHERFSRLRIRRTEQFRAAPELIEFIGAGIADQDAAEMTIGGVGLKSVRLDLGLDSHRLLRKLAADEGISMTQWVNKRMNAHLSGTFDEVMARYAALASQEA